MSIKDILAYADTPDHAQQAASAARSLCEKHDASVTGLFVDTHRELPTVKPMSGVVQPKVSQVLDSHSQDCMATFEAVFTDTPIDTYWRERDGMAGQKLSEEMTYRDLLIMTKRLG